MLFIIFTIFQVEGLAEKLGTPSFSIHSDYFAEALNKIDKCVTFLAQEKPGYANSAAYVVRYRAALSRALGIIRYKWCPHSGGGGRKGEPIFGTTERNSFSTNA